LYILIISLFAIPAAAYLSICLYMLIFQDKILYIPTSDVRSDPGTFGLEFTEHWITTSDNERLHSWYIPATNARYTLLFFHGNTGNISDRLDTIKIFNTLGLSILIIDYRGYGKSSGVPTEEGTYFDGDASWHYLVQELKIAAESIIIFGRSLGGGIATEIATRYHSAGLVLESTFSTMPAVAKDVYPLIPVSLIIHTKYANIDKIRQIHCPLLIIHSTEDEYIGFHHGQALYNAYNPRAYQGHKHFVAIAGAHNDGFFTSMDQYKQGINEYISILDTAAQDLPKNNLNLTKYAQ